MFLGLTVWFKAKRSTNMCTMVLKESIAYYFNNGSSVFCTLLDATKAFDRVEYVKMFKLLLDRKLPPVCFRRLVNMYTSQVTRVEWNGVSSDYFSVRNGVKHGKVISSVLFCVYVDGFLNCCLMLKLVVI